MDSEEEFFTKKEETISISLNRFSSGMSCRLTIDGAKNFDEAITKIMGAKKKLVSELEKSGEKIISETKPFQRNY